MIGQSTSDHGSFSLYDWPGHNGLSYSDTRSVRYAFYNPGDVALKGALILMASVHTSAGSSLPRTPLPPTPAIPEPHDAALVLAGLGVLAAVRLSRSQARA
ncbi:MAG: hypothetical protein QM742_09765 [Aquabacterium sp.]